MKATEISQYGRCDGRRRLIRFWTELQKLHFQTRQKNWQEQSCLHSELSSLSAGWGGRDRTSEWRNQNPLDYSAVSRRIWKKWAKYAPAISIAWLLFPNEKQLSPRRISPGKILEGELRRSAQELRCRGHLLRGRASRGRNTDPVTTIANAKSSLITKKSGLLALGISGRIPKIRSMTRKAAAVPIVKATITARKMRRRSTDLRSAASKLIS